MTKPDSTRPHVDKVCVYCASSTPLNAAMVDAAERLGRLLAERGAGLVYGGGAVGLMGTVADAVLGAGGHVTGIIPTNLFPVEVAHRGLDRLVEVGSMHERKAEMMACSDAFIALPGGFGTLEEFAEVLTWAQLGIHTKPMGLLNTDGFFDLLIEFFDRAVDDGILKTKNRELFAVADEPAELLDELERRAAQPTPHEPKWRDLDLN